MKVTLFIPCFVDLFYPQVGAAMVRILEKLGHSVVCPEGPACCGQPAFNTGYWEESRDVAVKVLESLQDVEVVVITSGSCGAMMKVFYPELFAGTEHEALARELTAAMQRFSTTHDDLTFGSEAFRARFVSMQGRADEAEAMAIEQLRNLGGEMLTDWAEAKHQQALEQVQAAQPNSSKHIKKK